MRLFFTQYCCVCGAPGQNYYNHYNDKYKKELIFLENKNTEWLKNVQVICSNYITEIGEYNFHGQVEIKGDNNLYNTAPSFWKYLENIPGILIHNVCFNILRKTITNFNCKYFFVIFKKYVGFYGRLENIYYGIKDNSGDSYKVNKGEEYLIENPDITKIKINKTNTEKIIIKKSYTFPNFLPPEIQSIILSYLDFKTMCSISNVCYYWYKLLINNKYWKTIFKIEYNICEIEESNIKQLFKLYYLDSNVKNKLKNRKRIMDCVDQINLIYQENINTKRF